MPAQPVQRPSAVAATSLSADRDHILIAVRLLRKALADAGAHELARLIRVVTGSFGTPIVELLPLQPGEITALTLLARLAASTSAPDIGEERDVSLAVSHRSPSSHALRRRRAVTLITHTDP